MSSEKFISGIHNYCDRWCERCTFSSCCAIYEPVSKIDPEENDFNNRKFWEKMSSSMTDAMRMLYEEAAKRGIDLDKEVKENEGAFKKRQNEIQEMLRESYLDKINFQYIQLAREWLRQHNHFDEIRDDALKNTELGIVTEEETMANLETINECLEIINWYLFFITVKFKRALSGKFEDDGWEEKNGFQKDSDGSAKIALIATKRTFDAWFKMFELLPGQQENLIPILAILQKIMKEGEVEFPFAKDFKRPGFDEVAKC